MPQRRVVSRIRRAVALSLLPGLCIGCGNGPGPGLSGGDAGRATQVAANAGWQSTGVNVEAGSVVTITVSGNIRDKDTTITGGGGSDYICGSPACCEPIPNVRRSALIARVGSITFEVGRGGTFPVTSDGPLLLRVNDCDDGLNDNSGTLTVNIAVP
jgi:hypothetical protein